MEEKQLDALVEAHYQEIYAYCYRHTSDRELAQDLTQATFLRFLQNLPRYREDGKLKNYLYTIASNLCKDWYKRKKPGFLEDLPRELAAFDPDIETALAVRAALEMLPFEQRNVLLLQHYHGFTAPEIAQITAVPLPTVRYRLQRAVKTLRNLLQEGKST